MNPLPEDHTIQTEQKGAFGIVTIHQPAVLNALDRLTTCSSDVGNTTILLVASSTSVSLHLFLEVHEKPMQVLSLQRSAHVPFGNGYSL